MGFLWSASSVKTLTAEGKGFGPGPNVENGFYKEPKKQIRYPNPLYALFDGLSRFEPTSLSALWF